MRAGLGPVCETGYENPPAQREVSREGSVAEFGNPASVQFDLVPLGPVVMPDFGLAHVDPRIAVRVAGEGAGPERGVGSLEKGVVFGRDRKRQRLAVGEEPGVAVAQLTVIMPARISPTQTSTTVRKEIFFFLDIISLLIMSIYIGFCNFNTRTNLHICSFTFKVCI